MGNPTADDGLCQRCGPAPQQQRGPAGRYRDGLAELPSVLPAPGEQLCGSSQRPLAGVQTQIHAPRVPRALAPHATTFLGGYSLAGTSGSTSPLVCIFFLSHVRFWKACEPLPASASDTLMVPSTGHQGHSPRTLLQQQVQPQ